MKSIKILWIVVTLLLLVEGGRIYLTIYTLDQQARFLTDNHIQAPRTEIEYNLTSNLFIKDVGVYKPLGYSMQPTFFESNGLIAQAYDGQELRAGQIIMYASNLSTTGTIVHRIRGVYTDYVITQGDNVLGYERVDKDDVLNIIVGVLYI